MLNFRAIIKRILSALSENNRNIPAKAFSEEQRKGAQLMLNFRWAFIALLVVLIGFQSRAGFIQESIQAIGILAIYLVINSLLWIAFRRNYDPPWVSYSSATLDISVVLFHLHFMSLNYDPIAVTAAASQFMIPIFFLLYTFRIDRKLLIYLISFSVVSFNLLYFYHYRLNPSFFNASLSVSLTAHIFKSIYLLFAGFLCVYLQHSIITFINKLLAYIKGKTDLDAQVKLEREKNVLSNHHLEQIREKNQQLEKEIVEKEQATNALTESRNQINSIVSNLMGAAYRCRNDKDWTMHFISSKIETISGYPASDFIGNQVRSYLDIIHPDDRDNAFDTIAEAARNNQRFELEYRVVHATGRTIWMHENGKAIRDENGNVLWLDGILTDITEKKKAEQELKETREMVTNIVSNLVGAPSRCYFDEDFTVKYYSPKIEVITGYPTSDFVDNSVRSFSSIMHPDDLEIVKEKVREAVKRREPYEFEYRIIHKYGHVVWVQENGQAIMGMDGGVEWLDGITLDISAKKAAEQAVIESETRYKELMDFLPQPIFELDTNGNLMFTNRGGQEFFGNVSFPQKGENSAMKYFIPEDLPRMRENFQRILDGVNKKPNEYTAIKSDGTRCPVIIYATRILRNGKVVGTRGIIVDISERKLYEENLIEAKNAVESINQTLEQTVQERTKELTRANTRLLKLEKENLQSQFEVLKQQVNPHFLFNSLNVLTSLISIDAALAETFTERLAKVYRYVLENKEKDLIPLSTELDFLRSYIFLIDIRFQGKVFIDIQVDEVSEECLIVPLALQLLIENAIKHNTFSKKSPLNIKLFIDSNRVLNVINNLQSRETQLVSTGVGLVNITKRYALLTEQQPIFEVTDSEFIAQIPLLEHR